MFSKYLLLSQADNSDLIAGRARIADSALSFPDMILC